MDNLDQAASLACWLMVHKKQKRNVAVIVGCNKYRVPFSFRLVVSKRATEIMKLNNPQLKLI